MKMYKWKLKSVTSQLKTATTTAAFAMLLALVAFAICALTSFSDTYTLKATVRTAFHSFRKIRL